MQEVKVDQVRTDPNGDTFRVLGFDNRPGILHLVKLTGSFGLGAGWFKEIEEFKRWRLAAAGEGGIRGR